MNEHKRIEEQVLKRITPSKSYRQQVQETLKKILKRINHELTKNNIPAELEIVGSIAKDTYLKNNLDIDIFLVFPCRFDKNYIAETTITIGKKILTETEECYAEHPYIRGSYNTFKIELVPCYKITEASEKLTAVDRTPLHTNYVVHHLKEYQKNEVRLLKQFLHGIGCYGAEAIVQGFSGYLCEILIIKCNSFQSLLLQGKDWKKPIVYSLRKDPIPSFPEPFIFVDPVDAERNVASAVSQETLLLFITACNEYLRKPQITFFFPNPIDPWSNKKIREKIQKENARYLGILIPRPNIIDENLYPQIRKACKNIAEECNKYGFNILDTQYTINSEQNTIYIILKAMKKSLDTTYTHVGPPQSLDNHYQSFIKKWENHPDAATKPYVHQDRIVVDVNRKWLTLDAFLIDNIPRISLGKHLDSTPPDKIKVLSEDELLTSNLQQFWTYYLDKKKPWER